MAYKIMAILIGMFLIPACAFADYDCVISILYTSNLGGEIESCGCSGAGITGLAKRNTLLAKLIAEDSIVIDCGDAFFKRHTVSEDELEQKKLKASYTVRCLDEAKIDIYVPGDRDFTAGSNFLLEQLIPQMKTTVLAANLALPKSKLIHKAGSKALIVGLSQGPSKSIKAWTSEKLAVEDFVSSLRKVVEDKGSEADLVIAVVHGTKKQVLDVAKSKLAQVVIDGNGNDSPKHPQKIAGTIVVHAPRDGRYIGRLQLVANDWKTKEIETDNRFFAVSAKHDDCPKTSKLVDEYKNELIKLYSSAKTKWKRPKKPTYWFDNVCGYCHPEQMEFWQTTKHAKAIKTLESRKAHMDKECIGCHTIGFREKGGWTHPSHLKAFANVQCEICHAPGAMHKKGTLVLKPSKHVCLKCHDKEHDPTFDYGKDILKIRCPDTEVKKIMAEGQALRKQMQLNCQPGSVPTILGHRKRGGLRPVRRQSPK